MNQSFYHYLNVNITERYDTADIISRKNAFFAFENSGTKN